ncbi:hypothetical protein llap_21943 [Limosa lapponica baueri]|uniref:Peptidase M1 membrane alanine aminopeptidase domain-containing protein n=1 Tax=Limosa lapponica baueri TaxID=1758121 RepID=A0A2I0T1S0_LIMLA|nr:hypothetical protein llap_21943 [Limosa lapponica baueri]
MSATSWEKQKDNTFVFKMSQPIPSYLIALAVGDIVSADVGPSSTHCAGSAQGSIWGPQTPPASLCPGLAYTCLEAATGRALLRQHMDNTGEDHPLNKLRVVIEPGVNPDDTYNETPYEKGYCFVSYLAHLVGDQSKFDAFLQVSTGRYQVEVPTHTKPCSGRPEHSGIPGKDGLESVAWERKRRWEVEMFMGK